MAVVGSCVGSMVGSCVGSMVGSNVGSAVGSVVGSDVGSIDGDAVGLIDGKEDGLDDGDSVGSFVMITASSLDGLSEFVTITETMTMDASTSITANDITNILNVFLRF